MADQTSAIIAIKKALTMFCGIVSIVNGTLFYYGFLIPSYNFVSAGTAGQVLSPIGRYPPYGGWYPFIFRLSFFFSSPFYIIFGVAVICATFCYNKKLLKILLSLTALMGVCSAPYYIYCINRWAYVVYSGEIDSPHHLLMLNPSAITTNCIYAAQVLLIVVVLSTALLYFYHKQQFGIVLATVIAGIAFVVPFTTRLWSLIAGQWYFVGSSNGNAPNDALFVVSGLACASMAYGLYYIIRAPAMSAYSVK
jgi:hypothetical protein